jgi:hypothetical protein
MPTVSKPLTYQIREFEYSADQIRTMGIAENFYVDNPEDGYRKDNRLWFGTCSQCRERVTSSFVDGVIWKHTVEVPSQFSKNPATKSIDYCPANPLG